jgi:putative FmdB family regulatory protein
MPIYEYTCDRCGETIERLERGGSPGDPTHDGCGGALTRLVSSPVTRTAGGDRGQSGDTDSMRRYRENRTLAAEKKKAGA